MWLIVPINPHEPFACSTAYINGLACAGNNLTASFGSGMAVVSYEFNGMEITIEINSKINAGRSFVIFLNEIVKHASRHDPQTGYTTELEENVSLAFSGETTDTVLFFGERPAVSLPALTWLPILRP